MEADFCPLMSQESKSKFDFELGTDLGYYSACSSLSPSSSVDSSCFSPPLGQFRGAFNQPKEPEWTTQAWETHTRRRTRSKNPGKKRQSASEREKLRMRDLTKALHHLRTFLPPSIAPAGQSLTKIETLRLTIRYISHLSSQLGHEEDITYAGDVHSRSAILPVQLGGFPDPWTQTEAQQNLQYSSPLTFTSSAQQSETNAFSSENYRDTPFSNQTWTHCSLADLL